MATPEKDSARKRATRPPPPGTSPWLSIVIPVRNESSVVEATLASLPTSDEVELIVVDGGSSDETPAIAAIAGAQVISSPPGRARQMNAGAAASRGEMLLFLHADTHLPQRASEAIRALTSGDGTVVGGAFRIAFGNGRGVYRWLGAAANLRTRFSNIPYGDQAIFVRRSTFDAIGGFNDLPIMEDVDFVHRLRRLGRFVILPLVVHTSDRRWRRSGLLRTTLANRCAATLYSTGVSPNRIRALYDRLTLPESTPQSNRGEDLVKSTH